MDLLNKEDFIWKTKHVNNIEENPIEYWYTTFHNGKTARKYYIEPQYPVYGENQISRLSDVENGNIELYIYFEARGVKVDDDSQSYMDRNHPDSIGDGYKYENNGTFKHAFKNIDDAKHRAYIDYCAVFKYAKSFIAEKR